MSTPPIEAPPGTIACPRCGAAVAPEQDWCLACGAAARTRLAPTPNWRAPIAVLGAVTMLAAGALAVAFVVLTDDDPATPAASTAVAPSAPPAAPATP